MKGHSEAVCEGNLLFIYFPESCGSCEIFLNEYQIQEQNWEIEWEMPLVKESHTWPSVLKMATQCGRA